MGEKRPASRERPKLDGHSLVFGKNAGGGQAKVVEWEIEDVSGSALGSGPVEVIE